MRRTRLRNPARRHRTDTMTGPHLLPLLLLYALMLPVTGMVPVLPEFTAQRFPGLGPVRQPLLHVDQHDRRAARRADRRPALRPPRQAPPARVGALARTASRCGHRLGLAQHGELRAAPRAVPRRGLRPMSALSLLMALAADHAGKAGLGARMGAVGARSAWCGHPARRSGASSATSTLLGARRRRPALAGDGRARLRPPRRGRRHAAAHGRIRDRRHPAQPSPVADPARVLLRRPPHRRLHRVDAVALPRPGDRFRCAPDRHRDGGLPDPLRCSPGPPATCRGIGIRCG